MTRIYSQRARGLSIAAVLLLAVAAFAFVWSLRSPDPQAQFHSALAALERGELNEVARAAHRIEKQPEFEPHARLLRGAVLLRSGDPESALWQFSQVAPEGDLREPAMLLTVECLYRLGRFGEAEGVARKLADEQPDNADARRWLGAIYYDLGANTLAVEELQTVAELDPQDYASHRLLGIMHLDFEEYREAGERFRKALKRSPPPRIRQEVTQNLAKALIAEREYEEALEVLETAEPTPQVLGLRAECHWSLNRKDVAQKLLAQAQQQAPDEPSILLLQGRIHLAHGNPRAAIVSLRRSLELDPHDAKARYQLAQAYRQSGDTEEFEEQMARWKESQRLLERLTALSTEAIERPSDGRIRHELAEVCQALGRDELAESWRRAAGAYQPLDSAR